MKAKKDTCDCCGDPTGDAWVKAQYTVPGYVMEWYYCSVACKEEHRLRLIRESGL